MWQLLLCNWLWVFFPEILADPTIIVFIHVNKPPLKLPDIQPTVYEPSFWTENICLKRSKGEHCTLYSLFKFLASSEQQQSNQEHFFGTHVPGVSILRYLGRNLPRKKLFFSWFYKKLGTFYKKLNFEWKSQQIVHITTKHTAISKIFTAT